MVWRSGARMTLQIISREDLHKHRAAQSSRSHWLLYQRLTNADSVGKEGGCCRDWLRNSQGPMKVRTKSTGRQKKYLVQAGSWGGPLNLFQISGWKSSVQPLQAWWECCAFFLFCDKDKLHLLLFAVYKENVEEWYKNIRAVILIRVFMIVDICQGPEYSHAFCILSPVPSPGSGCLYLRTATFWCSGVSLVRLLGKSCERPPWGLHSLPCEMPSGLSPCF